MNFKLEIDRSALSQGCLGWFDQLADTISDRGGLSCLFVCVSLGLGTTNKQYAAGSLMAVQGTWSVTKQGNLWLPGDNPHAREDASQDQAKYISFALWKQGRSSNVFGLSGHHQAAGDCLRSAASKWPLPMSFM